MIMEARLFPLRSGKASVFEGGMRVPCIMRFPKMISVNTICTNIITTLDILPTIANICDEEIDHDVDGVDIFSILDSSRHNLKDLSYIIPQAEKLLLYDLENGN